MTSEFDPEEWEPITDEELTRIMFATALRVWNEGESDD